MVGQGSGKDPPLVSLIAGGAAGGVESAATYPFEFAKTRVQLRYEGGPRNPFLIVGQVVKSEGIGAVYTGCSSMIVGTIGKDAVRFLAFDTFKRALADPETGNTTPGRSLLSGMLAGCFASAIAVTPTERIKTALIDDAKGAKRFKGPIHAIRLLSQERGVKDIYRGFVTTTVKRAGATSVRLGSYDVLTLMWKKYDIKQTTLINLASGSFAGITTTYLTQPVDVVKTRAQSAKGAGIAESVTEIWADSGIKGFWRGATMRLGRNVFSGAILFTAYENIAAVLRPALGAETAASS